MYQENEQNIFIEELYNFPPKMNQEEQISKYTFVWYKNLQIEKLILYTMALKALWSV